MPIDKDEIDEIMLEARDHAAPPAYISEHIGKEIMVIPLDSLYSLLMSHEDCKVKTVRILEDGTVIDPRKKQLTVERVKEIIRRKIEFTESISVNLAMNELLKEIN